LIKHRKRFIPSSAEETRESSTRGLWLKPRYLVVTEKAFREEVIEIITSADQTTNASIHAGKFSNLIDEAQGHDSKCEGL